MHVKKKLIHFLSKKILLGRASVGPSQEAMCMSCACWSLLTMRMIFGALELLSDDTALVPAAQCYTNVGGEAVEGVDQLATLRLLYNAVLCKPDRNEREDCDL